MEKMHIPSMKYYFIFPFFFSLLIARCIPSNEAKRNSKWVKTTFKTSMDSSILVKKLSVILEPLLNTSEGFCSFHSSRCTVEGDTMSNFISRGTKLNKHTFYLKEIRSMPEIPNGKFGRCAVVASGAKLLKENYGEEIDTSDSVFRLSFAPIGGKYAKVVGTKATGVLVRSKGHSLKNHGLSWRKYFPKLLISALYLPLGVKKEWSKIPRLYMRYHDFNFIEVLKEIDELLFKENHFSYDSSATSFQTGGKFALLLLSSKKCSHVKLYGFSADGDGHYYERWRHLKGGKEIAGAGHLVFRMLHDSGYNISIT